MIMKKICLIFSVLFTSTLVFAQTPPVSYKKQPSLGISFFMKDYPTPAAISNTSISAVLRDDKWTKLGDMIPGLSVNYLTGLSENVDFAAGLGGSFGRYPFKPNTVTSPNKDGFLLTLDANLNIKLLSDKYFLVPYATVGVGASMYEGSYFAAYMPIGVGLQFNLGSGTFLNLTAVSQTTITDLSTESYNYGLGFVSNIKDKPAPVLAPTPVEVDTDSDGIMDSKDKCPTVKGTVKYDGCPVPDTDGDGINDDNDKCPKVKGTAKYNGCPVPDTDGDGINDEDDKCPSKKGTAKYNGCPIPDTDGDGINDEEDKCPSVAGVARYQGCPIPDSDKDGINDEEDKCPNTPGVASNNGCPDLKEQYNFQANNIQFNTGNATLTKAAIAELNKLATILNEHAEIKKVAIEGHTDNTGKAENNQKLSERRAAAVQAYLVKKGVDASRLSNVGLGDTKPAGDNATKEGKALNRRVEFKVGE
jgi:OOP family OmpA-OmpF porin